MVEHYPVLLKQVVDLGLELDRFSDLLDLTAGYGGHSQALIDRFHPKSVTLLDQDAYAITKLRQKFATNQAVDIVQQNFRYYPFEQRQFDFILADLGVSSPQLDRAERGFSYMDPSQKLDMRMNQGQVKTAVTLLSELDQVELASILRQYGELRFAGSIAKDIVDYRQNQPIVTVGDLNQATSKYWQAKPKVQGLIYQALRIAVNDELAALDQLLVHAIEALRPGGVMAIISFHSLEDRKVKQKFREYSEAKLDIIGRELAPAKARLLTKRPIMPSKNEIVNNPRARSAKLRAIIKTKNLPN